MTVLTVTSDLESQNWATFDNPFESLFKKAYQKVFV